MGVPKSNPPPEEPASGIVARPDDSLDEVPSVVEGSFVEPSTDLDRPKMAVADFLQRVVDDLRARRAIVVGTDMTFERLRIKSAGYDLYVARFDPEKHKY